jgi:hypothetical protein
VGALPAGQITVLEEASYHKGRPLSGGQMAQRSPLGRGLQEEHWLLGATVVTFPPWQDAWLGQRVQAGCAAVTLLPLLYHLGLGPVHSTTGCGELRLDPGAPRGKDTSKSLGVKKVDGVLCLTTFQSSMRRPIHLPHLLPFIAVLDTRELVPHLFPLLEKEVGE